MDVQADDLHEALRKLRTYGPVRDRTTDREPREVILTDDEALALLRCLDQQQK